MQLKHLNTIAQAEDGIARILAISWAPNNSKLAYCTADCVIHITDETGEKKDKFSTKPLDSQQGKKNYSVKGIAFSPDSTKIAVGQTDNVVFVYKIGEEWGEKKTICNKFVQSSEVTCLIWLAEGPIVFGLLDGNVRSAHVKSSKSHTLYSSNSCVVALAPNHRGSGFISGHADGSIVRYYVAEDVTMEKQGRVCTHNTAPFALAWPAGHVLAGGTDRRVTVYKDGAVTRSFDYHRDATEKEFTVACCSPSGQAVVIGSYDRLRVYSWSPSRKQWEENASKEIPHLYSVTALAWKRDGSRVACGSLCGSVQLFESVLKRLMWKDKFELTYVGPSQVLVKPLDPSAHGVILRSQFGHEIEDVQIMGKDRYIVARTPETVLLGDLQRSLLSEIVWINTGGHERFYLDNPSVCLIFNAGELSLVEYGANVVLGSVRTEFMNPHQISVRLNERKQPTPNKKLAYLLDLKTIAVMDLIYGAVVTQVSHDNKVDWLELNETGQKLLFRDVKMKLTLFDVVTGIKTTLLGYSTFVQWVPGSDVAVAQSRNEMCVWYNIDAPDQVTMFPVKGEAVDVVRADGKTEIVVQEGFHQLGYELDEGLVEFGTAVHDNDLSRAVAFLESIGSRPEAEGMWSNLAAIALGANQLAVAERCFAALGLVSKMYHVAETRKLMEKNGEEDMEVRARMALLNHRALEAEAIYLQHNQLDRAIEMYQTYHKWDQAVALAESKGHPALGELRAGHLRWLAETKQEERAAEEKEKAGDVDSALQLYLNAGLPTRASRLMQSNPSMLSDNDVVTRVATALLRKELYEQAGELYEKVNLTDKAFDCYRRANAFSRAIELARFVSPADVVGLEEQWGDHLVAQKQQDAAINHFIEAGRTVKALEAAVGCRQWKKAVQIIQVIDEPRTVSKFYGQLGQHFAETKDYETAERLYTTAGMHAEAIEMYNHAGEWEAAHRLAKQHLSADRVSEMYLSQARLLQDAGKLREAEKLYVSVGQPDLAIAMYKHHKQYDHMMRLVTAHHRDLVQTTHLHLAQELEAGSNLRLAEQHYLAAGEWKGAVNMYRVADKWDDAYRIAKVNGAAASQQVAFLWAKSLGGESAVKLLIRLNLLQASIDYACELYQFEFAFELSRGGLKTKLPDVHYKYAMALEDEGKFREAETEFISAGKPKEAVLMYVHGQDWEGATRVAEAHDPDSVAEVLAEHAREVFAAGNFPQFESLLLRAQNTELILKYYKDAGMWVDALRVCREYLPSRLPALQAEYDTEARGHGSRDAAGVMAQARHFAESGQYPQAVDTYLKVTRENTPEKHVVLKAWTEVVELVSKFIEGPQVLKTAKYLAPQLVEMGEHSLAAQLYVTADLVKEAIDTFIRVEDWTRAKKIATDLEPSYEAYVDDCYRDSMRRLGAADRLLDVDVLGALDLLAERGQWDQCLETAARQSPQLLAKYVALQASQLIKDGFPTEALDLYTKHGCPAVPQNFNIYKRIAADLLGQSEPLEYARWAQLRHMFYQLTEALKPADRARDDFVALLLVSHYLATRAACKAVGGMAALEARLSISLLRHSDVVPADRAYYEAGIAARDVGQESDAFVFLNHFLDISEAMEEGNAAHLDHQDLEDTDFPLSVPLPATPFVTPAALDEVKEWVLTVSMDQRIDQVLPLDDRQLYPACLTGPGATGQPLPACVVSGYPVTVRLQPPVEFTRPGCFANRDDWMVVSQAAKVNSNMKDVVNFIETWCGQSTSGFSFT